MSDKPGTLELYCRRETAWKKGARHPDQIYIVHTVKEGQAGDVYKTLEEVADCVGNLFIGDSKGSYIYDQIVLYASMNRDVKDKPYIVANREEVKIFDPVGLANDLFFIQKQMVKLLEKYSNSKK